VPCARAGLDVTAHVGADDVDIVGPDGIVHHTRKRFGERSINYRHYLRELAKKPQAVRANAGDVSPADAAPPMPQHRAIQPSIRTPFAPGLNYVSGLYQAVPLVTAENHRISVS
jgi:hypothetical protein